MFALFIIKIFGLYSGICISKCYLQKSIVTKTQMTKIGSFYVVINIIVSLFFSSIWLHFISVFAPIIVFVCLLYFKFISLENQFHSDFPDFLTMVILKMKSGKSFRKSLQESVLESPMKYQGRLANICDRVSFSQQFRDKKMTLLSPFLSETIQIFRKIDVSSHRSIEKLENFRSRLITINNLRHKSGQIRGQIQLQCYLLLGIYVSCFAIVLINYQIREVAALLASSFILFLLGFLMVHMIGRSVRWKI